MSEKFPRPWRPGRRLSRRDGPFYGFITVYDATVDGDGDGEGRVIGFMQAEAAKEICDALEEIEMLRAALEAVRPALHSSGSRLYLNGPILSQPDAEKLLLALGFSPTHAIPKEESDV